MAWRRGPTRMNSSDVRPGKAGALFCEKAMKAAYIEATGGPDVIHFGDLPTPAPKEGEVLVRIGAAALNPIDLYVRAGTVAMPLPFPFVTGTDLAGSVEAVGPNAR